MVRNEGCADQLHCSAAIAYLACPVFGRPNAVAARKAVMVLSGRKKGQEPYRKQRHSDSRVMIYKRVSLINYGSPQASPVVPGIWPPESRRGAHGGHARPPKGPKTPIETDTAKFTRQTVCNECADRLQCPAGIAYLVCPVFNCPDAVAARKAVMVLSGPPERAKNSKSR